MLSVAGICGAILYQTPFGNHLFALGGDSGQCRISRHSSQSREDVGIYSLFRICRTVGGGTLTKDPQTNVSLGTGFELESIAAVVIGGTLLTGGRGTVLGTVLGSFFFTAVRSEMIAFGAPPSWYTSFVGIALGPPGRDRQYSVVQTIEVQLMAEST